MNPARRSPRLTMRGVIVKAIRLFGSGGDVISLPFISIGDKSPAEVMSM